MAKHAGGRPTKYGEMTQKLADAYLELCRDKVPMIPWIEELADQLDVDDATIVNWAATDDQGEPKHPQFFATYKKIVNLQKLRLKQAGMMSAKPTMPIFLLKVNHDMVETERKLVEVGASMEVPGIIDHIRKNYDQANPSRD